MGNGKAGHTERRAAHQLDDVCQCATQRNIEPGIKNDAALRIVEVQDQFKPMVFKSDGRADLYFAIRFPAQVGGIKIGVGGDL